MLAKLTFCLLMSLNLTGCQSQPTNTLALNTSDFFTPNANTKSIQADSLLTLHLDSPSLFVKPNIQYVIQNIKQTWQDLAFAQIIEQPLEPWHVYWYHPDSPKGHTLLKHLKRDPAMRGFVLAREKRMVLVGNPNSQTRTRWQQIIRHEAVHGAVFSPYPNFVQKRSWWLSEGLAMLWETPPIDHQPAQNPWRQPMLTHLFKSGQGLAVKQLLAFNGVARGKHTLAKNYARAWGLTYYLYHQQPHLLKQYLIGQLSASTDDLHAAPSKWLKQQNWN